MNILFEMINSAAPAVFDPASLFFSSLPDAGLLPVARRRKSNIIAGKSNGSRPERTANKRPNGDLSDCIDFHDGLVC
jgi:hypothetical protein